VRGGLGLTRIGKITGRCRGGGGNKITWTYQNAQTVGGMILTHDARHCRDGRRCRSLMDDGCSGSEGLKGREQRSKQQPFDQRCVTNREVTGSMTIQPSGIKSTSPSSDLSSESPEAFSFSYFGGSYRRRRSKWVGRHRDPRTSTV
jgi:hypothetical protein